MHRKTLFSALFLVVTVLVNVMGAIFAATNIIPLYLDSVLTIALTAYAGLFWGIGAAVLTNLCLHLLHITILPYMVCHISTALCAWLTFRHWDAKNIHGFNHQTNYPIEVFLLAGLWSALSNGILGNAVSTLTPHIEKLSIATPEQGLYIATGSLLFSVYLTGLLTNLVDKLLSGFISFFVWRMLLGISKK